MTDKQTLQQLIEGLPASKLPAAERFLTYLQQEDEEIRNTLERLAGDPALYDTDFYAWTQVQAAALRGKDWAALDIENLVEELEGMARSDRRALGSHLKNLLMHLLKWAYQPDRRGSSWQGGIEEAREAIEDLLEESRRSMEAESRRQFAKQRTRARRKASLETGLPLTTFPEPCQWSLEQVLDPDFLPEAPTQEARP